MIKVTIPCNNRKCNQDVEETFCSDCIEKQCDERYQEGYDNAKREFDK